MKNMNHTRTPYQVAAYIRAVVQRDLGKIKTVGRKYSEPYNWYAMKDRGWKHAWRYKYYLLDPSKENMDRAYEAYKLINDMAPRIEYLFGYSVKCHFTKSGDSLMFNVTPVLTTKPATKVNDNMIQKTNDSASGTSFHGNTIDATYNELVKCFGEPTEKYIDKSTAMWVFKHRDGFVFTVYDWKELFFSKDDYISWHIGAMDADQSHKAFVAVCDVLENEESIECDSQCGCGCDEPSIEVDDAWDETLQDGLSDEGPEFDGAGFSKEDRTETKAERFNVDDRVMVSDPGQLYDTFWAMRKAWNFDCGDNDLGSFTAGRDDMGVVVKRGYHYESGKQIYGVRLDNGTEIIIGHNGITKAPNDQLDVLIDMLQLDSWVSIDTIKEIANKIRNQYPNL